MANSSELNFKINFSVNNNGINTAMKQVDELRKALSSQHFQLFNNINSNQIIQMRDNVLREADKMTSAMEKAFNPQINAINIQRFKEELQKSGTSLEQVSETMRKAGPLGEQAFNQMALGLTNVRYQTVQTQTVFDKLSASLKRTFQTFVSINIVNKLKGSVNEAIGYVKNLDTTLNEIRIVTGKSADEMDRFAERANKAAAALGKATTDYTKASTVFYQQGLSDKDVSARTDVTMKVANTTGQDTKVVADNLTALWNSFNVGAEEAEIYVDRIAKLAATTATDVDEMTTAMAKNASMAQTMGISEEQLAAQMSTVISVTRQAPESIGTALILSA